MDIGAAAFWFFVAAAVVGGIWKKKHSEALRHETVRLLIEKGQKIDEAQMKELLNPTPTPSPWTMPQPKNEVGKAYWSLRVFGTIILFIAVGLGIMCLWRGLMLGFHDMSVVDIGTGVPMVAVIGAGLFFSSRFVPKPPAEINKEKQDQ
jgi:hypothetical protein